MSVRYKLKAEFCAFGFKVSEHEMHRKIFGHKKNKDKVK
jgi:hypothetical protein